MKIVKIVMALLLSFSIYGCSSDNTTSSTQDLPTYEVVNDNEPTFSQSDYTTESYIELSELDELGRTGRAMACLSSDTLPEEGETRESIGMVKPSGWQTQRYDTDLVDGGYLYNRCHQIAWCLSGLNGEEKNLMTGTRSFNVDGMLPFENMVCDYIKETGNHVLYESTPEFEGDELVARALHLQAASVEDDDIRFNVRIYNIQEGITINYENGDSYLENGEASEDIEEETTYILNTNTHKFHRPDCSSVNDMKPQNKKETSQSRQEIIDQGYEPCGYCHP